MYCNQCGAFIEQENSSFCHNCGSKLNTSGNAMNNAYSDSYMNSYNNNSSGNQYNNYAYGAQQNNGELPNAYGQENAPYGNTPSDDPKNRKPIVIACCVVGAIAVICAIVLGVFFFTKSDEPVGESSFEYDESYMNPDYTELKAGMRVRVLDVPDADSIEMRDYPSVDSELLIEIDENELVDILEDYSSEFNEYIFARYLEDGFYYDGWIPAPYLKYESMTDDYKTLKEGMRCRVISDIPEYDNLALRKSPSKDAKNIKNVPEADFVYVL